MTDIRSHVHVYLLLIAAILLAIGGLLSIWRMREIERQYDRWRFNQAVIVEQNVKVREEHAEILATLRRLVPPSP